MTKQWNKDQDRYNESKANEELKQCPNCNGLGVLTKTDHEDGLGLISNLCPACDGRGTVVASEHIFDPYPAMNNNNSTNYNPYTSDYPNRQKGFSSNQLDKIQDFLEDWKSDVCPKCDSSDTTSLGLNAELKKVRKCNNCGTKYEIHAGDGVNDVADIKKIVESKANEDFTNPYPNILSGTMPREQSPSERGWTTSDEDDWDNKLTHEEKKSKLEKLGYTQAESLATSRYYDLPHAVREALFYTDKPKELEWNKMIGLPTPYGFESKAKENVEKIYQGGWEFSVIKDSRGGYEVGIFAPDSMKYDDNATMTPNQVKHFSTLEDIEPLKLSFQTDPESAFKEIGGSFMLYESAEHEASEKEPTEVWCDMHSQWEDVEVHKEHIKREFGESEDVEEDFKKQAKDRGYGDWLDSGKLSITTLPSDFLNPKKKKGSKASELMTEEEMMNPDNWGSSSDAQKACYKQSGMPLLPNGEPDIENFDGNPRWIEELSSCDDYLSNGVNLWDHDTLEPVEYDDNISNNFDYNSQKSYYESKANEVDNSMDLGLLSGGIPEVNATNNEQCEICGQLIDQDLMDYHVEQEHGLHVPSQYTQDTISQSMGDPNYDHLEDWRTSYGENKKIANETESYQRQPQEWVCGNCGKQHVKFRISYVQTQYDGKQQQWNFDDVIPEPCDNYKPVALGKPQQDTWGESIANEYIGRCERCGLNKDVKNIDWDSHGDTVSEKTICEDCYYDIYGYPEDYADESIANEWSNFGEQIEANSQHTGYDWRVAVGDELQKWASRSPETVPIDKSSWINYVKSFKNGELLVDIANTEWEDLVGVGVNKAIRQSDGIYDYVDWNSLSESLPPTETVDEDEWLKKYSGNVDQSKKSNEYIGTCERCGLKEAKRIDLEAYRICEDCYSDMYGYADESKSNEFSIAQACKNLGIPLAKAKMVAERYGMDLQEVVDAGNLDEMIWDYDQDLGDAEREAKAEFGESEGEDEPEYYDETNLPEDLKDKPKEDVVVESEDDYEWEEDYKKFGDYEEDDDYDYAVRSADPNPKSKGSNTGTSKAEEALNKGASAEEIYSLVDTKQSDDDRTQSEDDYLTNLYNKTTANTSAGFSDIR